MNIKMLDNLYPCYSKDNKGFYVFANQDFLDVSSIVSADDIMGITDHEMPWSYNAVTLMSNDKHVIQSERTQVYFEKSVFNGVPHYFRSVKTPLLGISGKILGVQCVSIPVSDRCLIPLTKQQTACLRLLAQGFSHKQIGQEMGLSAKTVEHYLDAVKQRLSCESRTELIAHAIERGLLGVF